MKLEEVLQTDKFNSQQHKVLLNIMYTAYWLKNHVSDTLKTFDLTSEQFNVMRILKGKHPEAMCVKNIGSRMIEKSSNVPRIADRLLLKELIMRTTSTEDKRETLLSLTEKGLSVLHKASKAALYFEEHIIGIDDNEAFELNDLLEKLRQID